MGGTDVHWCRITEALFVKAHTWANRFVDPESEDALANLWNFVPLMLFCESLPEGCRFQVSGCVLYDCSRRDMVSRACCEP